MGRPRTSKSTIKNDPFAAVIPLPQDEPPPAELRPRRLARTDRKAEHKAKPTSDPPVQPPPDQVSQPAERAGRQKLTVHLDADLVNRVKNAAYWNPRLTIAKIAEQGIRSTLERIEKENGGRYPEREGELVGGRPIK